jgi:protoporphyrinogen oxidase
MVKNILILGAGPAGLSSALELSHTMGVTLVEKNADVGGLSRTLRFGDFNTDIGPHRFFTQNRQIQDLVSGLLGRQLLRVERFTRFYLDGKLFPYPVELRETLRNIGPWKGLRLIGDYGKERIGRGLMPKTSTSVEEELVARFGRTLAELNLLNYTEKVWGLPPSSISPDWTTQRIKGLSVMEILKSVTAKGGKTPKTLTDHFYYPERGAGMLYERIREEIQHNHAEIRTGSMPVRIDHSEGVVKRVEVMTGDGTAKVHHPEHLISSIPITQIATLMEPPPPEEILESCRNLRYRSHLCILIALDRPQVFPDQWIYFPEKNIPFARITEPRNFSKLMSPPGKTSLLVEFFCWKDDSTWNASREELTRQCTEWLLNNGFISRGEVLDSYIHRESHAYPVYDMNYKSHLQGAKDYFDQFANLILIGRLGDFRYNNQDHAIEMGILAARHITKGLEKTQIDGVGRARQYYERDTY